MIFTLAKFELEKWFKTGKIWKFLALCQFILGLIFYWLLEQYLLKSQNQLLASSSTYGMTEDVIHPLFAWTALLFFILTPLLATKSLTEERKSNTLELYLTTAIHTREIILGKLLGLYGIQLFLLLPTVLMPLCITVNDSLDLGQFLSGLLGLLLLLAANSCCALYISSLCKEPLMAAFMTFILLLFFCILEWIPKFFGQSFTWLSEFALLYHCQNFLSGLLCTQDIIYFILFSMVFLYFSVHTLNKKLSFKK